VPLLGAEPAWGAVRKFKGAYRDFWDTALRAQSIPILLKIAPADAGCAPKPHRKIQNFPTDNFSKIDEASLEKFAKCPCLGLNLRGAL